MIKFSNMRRGQFVGIMIMVVIFVVGIITISHQVIVLASHLAKPSPKVISQAVAATSGESAPTTIDQASFTYLVPASDPVWSYDKQSAVYDAGKGLVKYDLTFTNAKVKASLTQQMMPDQLKPRGSSKFEAFITASKVARSQPTGNGTVFFLSALKNGAPANGSDTIIYATDSILMFGRSDGVLSYDAWVTMLSRLKPVAK